MNIKIKTMTIILASRKLEFKPTMGYIESGRLKNTNLRIYIIAKIDFHAFLRAPKNEGNG